MYKTVIHGHTGDKKCHWHVKELSLLKPKRVRPSIKSNHKVDKASVNQCLALIYTNFSADWQTLAHPLHNGYYAAAFAASLKSQSGEGNLK